MGGKSGNELKFQEYYPRIKAQATIIDTYLIGRYYINIYNITDATANARSHAYHWSNFEKAMKYYGESNVDSALRYFEKAVNEDRFSRASLYRGNLYFGRGQYEQAREEYRIGLEDDCYDPKYWILYSVACKRTGQLTESERARNLAFKYEPYAGFINNLKF
jgi:Tfp pilus assembly protein PilF